MGTNSKPAPGYNPDLPPHIINKVEQRQKLARKKARQDKLLTAGCFLFGLAFLVAGLLSLTDSYRYSQNYLTAPAHVVEVKYISNLKCAVVEFQLEDGQVVKAPTDRCGKNESGVKQGDSLPIFYQPQNLAKVYSNDFGQRWLGPALLTLFGGVVIFVCFIPDLRRPLR